MPIIICVLFLLSLFIPLKFIDNYLSYPYAFEYRDAASISTAVDFSRGINPYVLQNYPNHMYVYGFLYPFILSPFISKVDHPIFVAKNFDILFLILFLGLSYQIFRKRKASIFSSLIGLLVIVNSTCYIWKINGSRPDIEGLFFAMLVFLGLFQENPNSVSIILGAISCLVSFYFKQYMFFSALVVFIYLFLFVSKKKACVFIMAIVLFGSSSYIIIWHFFPLYYNYSFIHHLAVVEGKTSFMVMQTLSFIKFYWLILLCCLLYLLKIITKVDFGLIRQVKINLKEFDSPFVIGFHLDVFTIGIIVSILLLSIFLGKNTGNFYTYYGELLLPFLLYFIIPKVDNLFEKKIFCNLLQIALIPFCVFPFYINYITDFNSYLKTFNLVSHYADQCKNIYETTPLMALYKIDHDMFPIYNNGQSEYYWTTSTNSDNMMEKFSLVTEREFNQRLLIWDNYIAYNIRNHKFDCIFTESGEVINGYQQIQIFRNVLGRSIYLFVPNSP